MPKVKFDEINFTDIEKLFPNDLNIPIITAKEMKLYLHLKKFPILKNNKNIINKRGEVDLTLYKTIISIGQKNLLKEKILKNIL